MKNKLFFSLALLVAANAFIATPASAITFKQAAKVTGRAILATGKATLGLAEIATGLALPCAALWIASKQNEISRLNVNAAGSLSIDVVNSPHAYQPYRYAGYVNNLEIKPSDVLPPLYIGIGAASIASVLLGSYHLKSAWNDFNNINN